MNKRAVIRPKLADPAPFNLDAERAILGRVIANDQVWWEIADRLTMDDFSPGIHRVTYAAMEDLTRQGRAIGHAALMAQIGDGKVDDRVTASSYLAGLNALAAERGVAGVPVNEFLDLVLHRSTCRHLIAAADQIRDRAISATPDLTSEDLRQDALKLISANDNTPNDAEMLGDVIARVITGANDASTGKKQIGIRTGLRSFDRLVGAMLPGQMIVLGGETSSGKTALATQLGYMLAQQGIPVDFISKEMGTYEIGARVLGTLAELSAERIIEGKVESVELDRMMTMGERVVRLPFWITDKPRQTVGMTKARLARAVVRNGIRVAFIDHLQYQKPDNPRSEEREQIRQVADDDKAMAKSLGIVLILISHVVRTTDFSTIRAASDVKRPTLRDLYGSSAIEKAADAVVFVHRPGWFLERATPPAKFRPEWEADKLTWEGKAELVLAKRRSGRGYGVEQCWFDETRTWFKDM